MIKHIFHTAKEIKNLTKSREGEIKTGQKITILNSLSSIIDTDATYIILGICEDIGVSANHGKPGCSKAYPAFLDSYLNTQNNSYNACDQVALAGTVVSSYEQQHIDNCSIDQLSELTEEVDRVVTEIVSKIAAANKIAVVIGGGHNNAYGILKGYSLALQKPLNCINIDAHTDLRKCDRRHSGNGFSFALKNNYLNCYHIFGLHHNYTPQYIFDQIAASPNITFDFFEDMLDETVQHQKFKEALSKTGTPWGLEIDCDALGNFPASAKTPSGFSINSIRQWIKECKSQNKPHYLHICEAAPETNNSSTGKTLSYFVTDFIQ